MAEEKLLTVREVSLLLNISEKEVMDLAETGAIPAYKVGGVYVRFKKDQVQEYHNSAKSSHSKSHFIEKNSFADKISDFFYFNDFYILAVILVILLLTIIVQG